MSIYTKKGDYGLTSLLNSAQVSKTDDRIKLNGDIDELTSHLGLIKASHPKQDIKNEIERIQENLKVIMAGVADQYNREYKIPESDVTHLEEEINHIEELFPKITAFILPGANPLSAQIDIARAITRRVERYMIEAAKKYNIDGVARKYINRLSDYLYILARYTDFLMKDRETTSNPFNSGDNHNKGDQIMENTNYKKNNNLISKEDIVNAVINKIGVDSNRISLELAKKLIERIEEYSSSHGLNAVIAICGPDGNPIAVHVMDDAFLASFEIAMNKAYTSVAVKMSTQELSKLAQPGETFYGIDKADNGRMTIIGGGVPLKVSNRIIGGLGVSGGTAEEDNAIAEYGLKILEEIIK